MNATAIEMVQSLITEPGRKILSNNKFLRQIYVNYRFNQEIKLLNNRDMYCDVSYSPENPSILFFTLHKCGSVFSGKVLKYILKNADMSFVDLYGYFDMSDDYPLLDYIDSMDTQIVEKIVQAIRPQGYVYAPLRFPNLIPYIREIKKYKIILMIRDPREIIVSAYYSFGFTHALPVVPAKREKYLREKKQISSMTLDEYVYKNTEYWKRTLLSYYETILKNSEQNLLLKYETLNDDFFAWLQNLVDFLGVEPSSSAMKHIIFLNQSYKTKKRKNLLDCLEKNTLNFLDQELADVMFFYGYK